MHTSQIIITTITEAGGILRAGTETKVKCPGADKVSAVNSTVVTNPAACGMHFSLNFRMREAGKHEPQTKKVSTVNMF